MFDKIIKLLKIHFASSLVLKDGTPLQVEGDFTTGAQVSVVTSDGTIPLPDGEYQLEDMTIITVKDGLIMDIVVPGEVEMSAEEPVVEVELAQKENPEVSGPEVVVEDEPVTTGTTETIDTEMVDMPEEPVLEPEVDEEMVKIADLEAKVAALEQMIADLMAKLNLNEEKVNFITEKLSIAKPVNMKVEVDGTNKMPVDQKLQNKIDLINRLKKK